MDGIIRTSLVQVFHFALLTTVTLLVLSACSPTKQFELAKAQVQKTKQEFIPDGRTRWYRIEAEPGRPVRLTGATVDSMALHQLRQELMVQKIKFVDETRLLPAEHVRATPYGLVNISVANIRSQPKHSSELSTQALLGTLLRIWDRNGDWYLIQTPDDYFGWLDAGALVLIDDSVKNDWLQAEKVVVTSSYSFVYERPDLTSTKMSDLVAGNLLPISGGTEDFLMISLPDGRVGYVPQSATQPFNTLKKSAAIDGASLLKTAKEYLGRPYLWGGTSGKAFDCSGYTKTVFFQHGYILPRDASQQVHVGKLVTTSIEELHLLQPADLLFFGNLRKDGTERVTHVGFYLGNCEVLHATGSVKIESLCPDGKEFASERRSTFLRAKRILGATEAEGVLPVKKSPWY